MTAAAPCPACQPIALSAFLLDSLSLLHPALAAVRQHADARGLSAVVATRYTNPGSTTLRIEFRFPEHRPGGEHVAWVLRSKAVYPRPRRRRAGRP